MKTVEEIRKELRDTVKFSYNLPEATLEKYRNEFGGNAKCFQLLDKYDELIKNAPPTLQKVYKLLYIEGLTQKDAAYYLCYSEKYVQRLNKQLILFFQQAFG